MLVSDNKSSKRFIICYKKEVNNEFIKQPPIIQIGINMFDALDKALTRLNIPIQKIMREDKKAGYIYCNEVYNARFEEDGIILENAI